MDVAGIVAERFADQCHQESLPRGDIRQPVRRGDTGRRVRTVIPEQKPLQLLLGNRFDPHPPSVEHLQFGSGSGVVMALRAVAADLRTLPSDRNKAVLAGFGSGQKLDDLGGDQTLFHSSKGIRTKASMLTSGIVGRRVTSHQPRASTHPASR